MENKIKNIWIFVTGIIFFVVSFKLDGQANKFFEGIDFTAFSYALSFITSFAMIIVVMVLVPSFIFYRKKSNIAKLLILAFIVSFALAFILKLIVLRERPETLENYPFTSIPDYSFPSMHAMAAFALLPILNKYLPKQKVFWVIFGILIAFSRIYFGVHFLTDVVFGAFFGYFVGYALLTLHKNKKLWIK